MGEMKSIHDPVAAKHDRMDQVFRCSARSGERRTCSSEDSPIRFDGRPQQDPDRLHAMIVDDDVVVLQLVKRIFESFGYRVSTAGGSAEAMADLSVRRYDLLVTDFEMPGMNGFGLANWLKAESPATRVVLMTGRCRAEIPPFMIDGSVDGWIFKPFRLADVRNVLDGLEFPRPSECAS
jgi:two-component system capsular synthesis sensor histidine kinase RcsC